MQVEAIYTFTNYLYIITSGFFSQNKDEKICLISWGRFFKKKILPLALVGYEMIIANSALRTSLAIIYYPTRARGIIVKYKLPSFRLTSTKLPPATEVTSISQCTSLRADHESLFSNHLYKQDLTALKTSTTEKNYPHCFRTKKKVPSSIVAISNSLPGPITDFYCNFQ